MTHHPAIAAISVGGLLSPSVTRHSRFHGPRGNTPADAPRRGHSAGMQEKVGGAMDITGAAESFRSKEMTIGYRRLIAISDW
jgi:hypothetical protein